MNKFLALLLAVVSVALMCATAIAIDYSAWLAVLFFLLTCATIVTGFVVKSRTARKTQER